MSDGPDEMSAELRALLESERQRPGPSAADRDALRADLAPLFDGSPGGGGSEGGGAGSASGTGGAAAAGGSALAKVAAIFAAGALAGGALVWTAAPRTIVVERVATPAPTVSVATPAAPTAIASTEAAPVASPAKSAEKVTPVAPAKSAAAPSAEKRDEDLASERALLERARVALGRGDATGALEALDRHSARHPSGRLAEEREVLAVQALVSAGRRDEAQARAARFHREHPSSAFGSAIDALVR